MKKLIHKYLSEYYCLVIHKTFVDRRPRIVIVDKQRGFFTSRMRLSGELSKIFGFTEKQLKWYIKSWCWKQDKAFNFKDFWWFPKVQKKWKFNFKLPHITTYRPLMMGQDLISVDPMGNPSSMLFYVNYYTTSQGIEPIYQSTYTRSIRPSYNEEINS